MVAEGNWWVNAVIADVTYPSVYVQFIEGRALIYLNRGNTNAGRRVTYWNGVRYTHSGSPVGTAAIANEVFDYIVATFDVQYDGEIVNAGLHQVNLDVIDRGGIGLI